MMVEPRTQALRVPGATLACGVRDAEFGQRGEPDAFAAVLRRVLDEEGVGGASRHS